MKLKLLSLVLLSACSWTFSASGEDKLLQTTSPEARLHYLKTAEVWSPVDPSAVDIWKGPDNKFRARSYVSCDFQEYYDFWNANPMSGFTNKFRCNYIDANGKSDSIKVKYNLDARGALDGEVNGEIASSRLLWALGFGADRMYPVSVECNNCPKDPWLYHSFGRLGRVNEGTLSKTDRFRYDDAKDRGTGSWTFSPAAIEKKFKGVEIGAYERQGWSWREFMDYSSLSREKAIHREALALLAGGFLHHPDSKTDNQRLVCLESGLIRGADGTLQGCSKPFALVADLGWTFTPGIIKDLKSLFSIPKMNLEGWKAAPVFKGSTGCIVNSRGTSLIRSTLDDFEASEEGRVFLLGLLKNLDKGKNMSIRFGADDEFVMTPTMQIFYTAFVDLDRLLHGPSEGETTVETIKNSVLGWTAAFHDKVREIESRSCRKKFN